MSLLLSYLLCDRIIHHSCITNLSLRYKLVTCKVSKENFVLSGLQEDYDKLVSHPRRVRHESTVSHFFLMQ